ncbi:5-formyl-3-hydroxy-2-methylpyridine 4-carboxylate 5-dehydrogenase [Inquilinus limosus]|uniref:3-hydroxybutyryl-CoA dehydrogenase n=1 Tax=Inquilinus limosus TaxID=171674 RepID=A0A211ZQC9_9PROT|nr:5-formyl-3-hydroxy-2-methylpyridine 4-carboxylate 5-dehydrogenase [Inquilinus limosus]OWJ67386.1 3-hydroxybutyryl-CoA dehydrogenase [Inquilinus limosus]
MPDARLHVAVIGLGTMGPGIAATLARGGMGVRVHDTVPAAIERARAAIPQAGSVLDRLGIAPPDSGEGAVSFHEDLESAVAGAGLVIENVPEKVEVKAAVYRALDPLLPAETIVASDTSGIPITTLQGFLSHPERLIGMHWSNPPHIIPMIEVIAGRHTAPATVSFIADLVRSLKLLPVVVKKDVPGFVENRILYALLREAIDLVDQGVIDEEGMDTCVSWGIGYKLAVVGPMRLLDMAGLDIYQSVASFLNADLSDRKDVAGYVTERARAGKLGIKSGEGIFPYTPEQIRELQAERARQLVAVRRILEGRDG